MKLRVAFKLDRYIDVMVGLLLLIIGLTGSALVFWYEIDYSQNLHFHRYCSRSFALLVLSSGGAKLMGKKMQGEKCHIWQRLQLNFDEGI